MISHLILITGLLFTTSSSLIMNDNTIGNDIVMYADEGDAHGFVESVTDPTDNVYTLPRGNVSYNTFSLYDLSVRTIQPPNASTQYVLEGTFETPPYIDSITFEPLWNNFSFKFQMNWSRGNCNIGSSNPSSSNHFTFLDCNTFNNLQVGFETSGNTANVRFPELVYDIIFYLELSIDIDGAINYTLPFVTLHLNETNSLILYDDLANYVTSINQSYTLDTFVFSPFVSVRIAPTHDDTWSNNSYNIGYGNGYDTGYLLGNQEGYNKGYQQAQDEMGGSTFANMFYSLLNAPFKVLKDTFDLNIFGINLSQMLVAIFSIVLVIWLIGKFKGKKGDD